MSKTHIISKGTVWYFSDIVAAITTMITMMFMLFVCAILLFTLSTQLDVNVIGKLMYETPKMDTALLTYLDSTDHGYSMKELLSYAVYNENYGFSLAGQGYDMKSDSVVLLDKILPGKPYVLKIRTGDAETVLASKGKIIGENITAETFIQGGENSGRLYLTVLK